MSDAPLGKGRPPGRKLNWLYVTGRWRAAAEVVALLLKVLAAAVTVYGAAKGCGPV